MGRPVVQSGKEDMITRISKEEINLLPLGRWEGPVRLVRTCRRGGKSCGVSGARQLLGFDTETRPAFRKGRNFLQVCCNWRPKRMSLSFSCSRPACPNPCWPCSGSEHHQGRGRPGFRFAQFTGAAIFRAGRVCRTGQDGPASRYPKSWAQRAGCRGLRYPHFQVGAHDQLGQSRSHPQQIQLCRHRCLDRPGDLSSPPGLAAGADRRMNFALAYSSFWSVVRLLQPRLSRPPVIIAVVSQQIAADEQGFHEHGGGGACQPVMDQPEAGGDQQHLPQLLVFLRERADGAEN